MPNNSIPNDYESELKNPYNHALLTRQRDIGMMIPYWWKVHSIIKGLEAMKYGKECFLPKFPNETDDNYTNRLNMAKLTNVFRDVLEGLATKPFESEVTLLKSDNKPIPTTLEEFADNVDGSFNNLTVFSAQTFFDGIADGISWIFIDYPDVPADSKMSIADAKKKKLAPYWTHVLAKNVLEVRRKVIGNEFVISYIRIYEPSVDHSDDKIRIFERDDNNNVTWELHKINATATSDTNAVFKESSGTLSIGVIPMVPFITGRRDGNTWRFFPPMEDAADLQITLYQNETGLEYIKTLACYPMLAANGLKPPVDADGKAKKVAVGPMQVLYAPMDGQGNNGEWKFIEPTANSLEFLKKSIDSTKTDLRELGRQPLTALSSQLTTVTTSVAAGKGRSAVTAWALALKDALENSLKISLMYEGENEYEPEVNVYTGFDNVDGSSDDVVELGKARERGDISRETYWDELRRRKILSPEFNSDEEARRLLAEVPSDGLDSPVVGGETQPKDKTNVNDQTTA